MTPTGAIVFLALIVMLIGGLAWLFARESKRGEKFGRATVTVEEQAEILGKVEAAQEIERELETEIAADPKRRAADRLREQWSRD